jgi:ubiquinol-cytochrome c reductase iron-sulfur subunit
VKRWLWAAVVLLLGRRRGRQRRLERPRIVADAPPRPGSELLALVCFGCATLCAAAFVAVYALDRLPHQTQLLGLALGLALAFLAAAAILIGMRLVPQEELVEPYPPEDHPAAQQQVVQITAESATRLTRRRLLYVAGGGAVSALGVAALTPAASLGPVLDLDSLYATPWRRGVRLVDEGGHALLADAIEQDTFYTAYPHGADREQVGAPLVLVRLEPAQLDLPPDRRDWAPDGIVAYSKICTHAGCAISLYRKPTFAPTQPRPALVCPCHYSTFDPATGGSVLFGPAGRPLPQLPLAIDRDGALRAGGGFSGHLGPSWWGVKLR